MEAKPSDLNARSIPLKQARITLLWPLTLHMKDPPLQAAVIDETVMGFVADLRSAYKQACSAGQAERVWVPVDDPLEHIPRPVREAGEADAAFDFRTKKWENDAYAEAVYFHEFIQDFLYRPEEHERDASFWLFRRTDVRHAKVRFNRGLEKQIDVERINLYLFRTGVAVFTMDLVIPVLDPEGSTSGWSLAEFLTFHDLVRRAYAPYFELSREDEKTTRKQSHLVLEGIEWLDGDGRPLLGPDGQAWDFDLQDHLGEVETYIGRPGKDPSRYPPLFRHWRVLLSPHLPLAAYDQHREPLSVKKGSIAAAARWHHVVDERMPTLATVSVSDHGGGMSRYERISDGDMVRLCFADVAGDDPFPYDQRFLEDFDRRFAYDRFRSSGTRFLVSGYSFVALVSNWFGDNVVSMHMRRHYFQMALLAHMEMASLLGFSGQVSRAVKKYGSGDENRQNLERCMAAIQEEFLQFVHRFRFTGVSNQLQAQELFELWRRNLRTETLFADVKEEIAVANEFLRAEAGRRSTEAAEWLSLLGAVGVLLGVIIGLLGMNFIADPEFWRPDGNIFDNPARWSALRSDTITAGIVVMAVGVAGALSSGFRWRKSLTPVLKPVFRISAIFAVLGAVLTAVAWSL